MLGRKTYTTEEYDQARTAVTAQLAVWRDLTAAAGTREARAALAAFEPLLFNSLALALDRRFVHRVRPVTGKDGNPLNELELLSEALMTNNGVLDQSRVIELVPEQSVTGIGFGHQVQLTAEQFERPAGAFLDELERRFVTGA